MRRRRSAAALAAPCCSRTWARDGYPGDRARSSIGGGGAGRHRAVRRAARCPPAAAAPGLLGHRYRAKLIGLAARQHTGWLTVRRASGALYAPHTETASGRPRTRRCCCSSTGCSRSRACDARRSRRAGRPEARRGKRAQPRSRLDMPRTSWRSPTHRPPASPPPRTWARSTSRGRPSTARSTRSTARALAAVLIATRGPRGGRARAARHRADPA